MVGTWTPKLNKEPLEISAKLADPSKTPKDGIADPDAGLATTVDP